MPSLRAIGRRPTLWVEAAVAAAWTGLLFGGGMAHGSGAGGHDLSGDPLWICTIGLGGGAGGPSGHAISSAGIDPSSLLAAGPAWALMTVAMMVPAALPAVGHVARTSLYLRRRRAAAEFLAVFVGLWTAFGVLVLIPLSSWEPVRSPLLPAAALAAAALWQLTPLKHRALLACHRSRPLPPRGWRASVGTSTFALYNGSACLASCWAMMAAATLAGPAQLGWMGAMTGMITVEKLAEKPRRASRRIAALLAAAALGVGLAAFV